MSSKRNHKTLTLKEKMDIFKKLDSGQSMCKLAKEYGIGRATVHDLKKKRQKIVEHVNTMESGPGKRKTLRVGGCSKMENALYAWFLKERSKHIHVSGEILKAKAIEFYQEITKKDDFRASIGWLDKFKRRFGIRLLSISGGKLSSDGSVVQPFNLGFNERVEEPTQPACVRDGGLDEPPTKRFREIENLPTASTSHSSKGPDENTETIANNLNTSNKCAIPTNSPVNSNSPITNVVYLSDPQFLPVNEFGKVYTPNIPYSTSIQDTSLLVPGKNISLIQSNIGFESKLNNTPSPSISQFANPVSSFDPISVSKPLKEEPECVGERPIKQEVEVGNDRDMFESVDDLIRVKTELRDATNVTEFDSFGQSIAEHLKKMSVSDALELQLLLQKTVSEFRIRKGYFR